MEDRNSLVTEQVPQHIPPTKKCFKDFLFENRFKQFTHLRWKTVPDFGSKICKRITLLTLSCIKLIGL